MRYEDTVDYELVSELGRRYVPPSDEYMAWHAAQMADTRAGMADDVQDYYTTPAPSRDGCMVLIVGLGLVAFEGLVRWLA